MPEAGLDGGGGETAEGDSGISQFHEFYVQEPQQVLRKHSLCPAGGV